MGVLEEDGDSGPCCWCPYCNAGNASLVAPQSPISEVGIRPRVCRVAFIVITLSLSLSRSSSLYVWPPDWRSCLLSSLLHLYKFMFLIMHMHMCLCEGMCTRVQEGVTSPGVTGSGELPNLGMGDQT